MHRKKSVPLKEIDKFREKVIKELEYEIHRLSHLLRLLKKKKGP